MAQSRLLLPLLSSLALLSLGAARGEDTPADRNEVIHVLNRITFGPRPGDVEMVQKMGLHNYIEQQLHPETIDDFAVDQEIGKFEILQMNSQQLTDLYIDEVKKLAKKAKKQAEAKLAAGTPPAGAPAAGTQVAANQPAAMQSEVKPGGGEEQIEPQDADSSCPPGARKRTRRPK